MCRVLSGVDEEVCGHHYCRLASGWERVEREGLGWRGYGWGGGCGVTCHLQ
jgi:hypothetical protein